MLRPGCEMKSTPISEITGKTIKGTIECMGQVLIAYTDGTFTCLEADKGWGDDCPEIQDKDFWQSNWDINALFALGIVSQEALDEYNAKEAERKRIWEEARAKARRAEYEKLKAEFE